MFVACSWLHPGVDSGAPERPISVVALSAPAGWVVEQIGGEAVEVTAFTPPGERPDSWRPSAEAIAGLHEFDLIVASGAGFEDWMRTAALPRSRLVDTARGLHVIELDGPSHSHGPEGAHSHRGPAPYTWHHPASLVLQAEAVHGALVSLAPDQAKDFDDRLAGLQAELSALGARARALDSSTRPVVANHPTFVYLFRAAALDVPFAHLPSTGEPDPTQVDRLATLLDEAVARTGRAPVLVWDAPVELQGGLPASLKKVESQGQTYEVTHLELDPAGWPLPDGSFDLLRRLGANLDRLEQALRD